MSTKIIALKEKLHEEDVTYKADINELGADLFVYSYEYGSCDGDGFAVWRKGKKWYYTSLSHCSCFGPFDELKPSSNAGFTLAEVKKVATELNYDNHAVAVMDAVKKLLKKK